VEDVRLAAAVETHSERRSESLFLEVSLLILAVLSAHCYICRGKYYRCNIMIMSRVVPGPSVEPAMRPLSPPVALAR
jgi:hypothetical protein